MFTTKNITYATGLSIAILIVASYLAMPLLIGISEQAKAVRWLDLFRIVVILVVLICATMAALAFTLKFCASMYFEVFPRKD